MYQQITTWLVFALLGVSLLALPACNRNSINIQKLNLTDLEGNKVALSNYKGKRVVLNFWASWCGQCIMDKKWMDKAQKELEGEDIVFLAVSEEDIPVIKRFKERRNYDFTYLKIHQNIKTLGIFYIPHTFILNKEGELVFSHNGVLQWNQPDYLSILKGE